MKIRTEEAKRGATATNHGLRQECLQKPGAPFALLAAGVVWSLLKTRGAAAASADGARFLP